MTNDILRSKVDNLTVPVQVYEHQQLRIRSDQEMFDIRTGLDIQSMA